MATDDFMNFLEQRAAEAQGPGAIPMDPETLGGAPAPGGPKQGGDDFEAFLEQRASEGSDGFFSSLLPGPIAELLSTAASGISTGINTMRGRHVPTEEPSTFTKTTRPSAIAAGATAGGILGSRVPVAPGFFGLAINPVTGSVVGGALGAAAGTVAPETVLQVSEWLGIVPKGTREAEGRPTEELKKMVEGEAWLDATFGVAGQIPRLLARPLAQATNKITKQSQELARFAHDKLGIDLLPWQAGGDGFGRRALNVLGRFPMVGSPARGTSFFQRLRTGLGQAGTDAQAREALENLPARFGQVDTFPDLSHALLGDAERLLKDTTDQFGQVYKSIWDEADRYGITVVPANTKVAAGDIIDEITRRSGTAGGDPVLSAPNKQLVAFIENNVNALDDVQTMRGFDGIVDNLDTFIKTVEPAQRGFIMRNVNILREAMKKDMLDSVAGPHAKDIAEALAETDATYSKWLADTFETATALRFGKVKRHGIRGWGFDRTTQSAIDGVAEHVLDLNSPQAIDELLKLAGRPTAQRLAATVVEQGLQKAMVPDTAGRFKFDVEKAQNFFGLGDKTSGRYKAMEKLLNASSSPLGMADLDKTFQVMRALSSFSIPGASDFIARRGTLGGSQAIINGILFLGAPAAAGSAGGASVGMASGLLMFLGARGFARAISNPLGARAWREVASKEARLGNRRASALRLLRLGITEITNTMITEDNIDPREAGNVGNDMYEKGAELVDQLGAVFEKGFQK